MLLFDRETSGATGVSRATWRLHDATSQTPDPNFFSDRSRRIVSPVRRSRATELWLVVVHAAFLRFQWEAMTVDPLTVARVMAELKMVLPPWQRRQFAGAITDLMEEGELRSVAGDPEDLPMLLAATRWFCALRLPRTADDLWLGPPVFSRTRRPGSQA